MGWTALDYRRSPSLLAGLLLNFKGGQFLLGQKDVSYGGVMRDYRMMPRVHSVTIIPEWVCEIRPLEGESEENDPPRHWVKVPPGQIPEIKVDYSVFYDQKDEERIKLKSWGGVCYFLKDNNPFRLVPIEEDSALYLPYHQMPSSISKRTFGFDMQLIAFALKHNLKKKQ